MDYSKNQVKPLHRERTNPGAAAPARAMNTGNLQHPQKYTVAVVKIKILFLVYVFETLFK